LRAYNWHPVDEDSLGFVLTAAECTAGGVGGVCGFRAREAFRRRELALPPLAPGTLLDEEGFRIESVVLDHGTPCLALAFQEKLRINVWREGLHLLELPVGPWLNEAKRAVRRGAPDDSRILIRDDRFVPLGVLKAARAAQRAWTQNRLRGRRRFPCIEHREHHRVGARRRPALHRDGIPGRGRRARRRTVPSHRRAGGHARKERRRFPAGAVSFLCSIHRPGGSTSTGGRSPLARMTRQAMCCAHARSLILPRLDARNRDSAARIARRRRPPTGGT